MGSQNLLALTSKRAEISECIGLLEGRRQVNGSLAVRNLIDRLNRKIEWLDMRIELERQQSDPLQTPAIAKMRNGRQAA